LCLVGDVVSFKTEGDANALFQNSSWFVLNNVLMLVSMPGTFFLDIHPAQTQFDLKANT